MDDATPAPSRASRPWGTWLLGALVASVVVAAIAIAASTGGSTGHAGGTATSTMVAPTDGLPHTDPAHYYVLQVAPGWIKGTRKLPDGAQEGEIWAVGRSGAERQAGIGILVAQVGPDATLQRYLEVARSKPASFGDVELASASIVTGFHGNQLGRIEYIGQVPGTNAPKHYLAFVDIEHGTAVIATLNTPPATFASIGPVVEPYLRTLWAT